MVHALSLAFSCRSHSQQSTPAAAAATMNAPLSSTPACRNRQTSEHAWRHIQYVRQELSSCDALIPLLLAVQPDAFDVPRSVHWIHCCTEPVSWQEGRMQSMLTAACKRMLVASRKLHLPWCGAQGPRTPDTHYNAAGARGQGDMERVRDNRSPLNLVHSRDA